MTVAYWSKPNTQQTLKELRQAGFKVVKSLDGVRYEAFDNDPEELVFRALKGRDGYLVRYAERLFTLSPNDPDFASL